MWLRIHELSIRRAGSLAAATCAVGMACAQPAPHCPASIPTNAASTPAIAASTPAIALPCTKPWTGQPPAPIRAAAATTIAVRFGPGGGFSSVRVSHNLLLTAAHCIVGFKGDDKREPFRLEHRGKNVALEVVEIADYRGIRGHMSDWAVLKVSDPSAIADVAIADFADRGEMNAALRSRAATIRECGMPVWTISYPSPSVRLHPRPPIPGKLQRFVSRGFLQSHAAYREQAALAWETGILYDQQYSPALPPIPLDVDKVWQAHADQDLVKIYDDYQQGGDPLIYHSADFSPGSSGGGIFMEATGKLLGIVAFGTSVRGVDPRKGWAGFYELYRIDRVCLQSRTLAALDKCKRLSEGQ